MVLSSALITAPLHILENNNNIHRRAKNAPHQPPQDHSPLELIAAVAPALKHQRSLDKSSKHHSRGSTSRSVDVEKGPKLKVVGGNHNSNVGCVLETSIATTVSVVAAVLVGQQVWLADRDAIMIRSAGSGLLEKVVKGGADRILCLLRVTLRQGDEHVWVGMANTHIRVFEAATASHVGTLGEHTGAVLCLAQVGTFVFSGASDFTIRQWNSETLTLTRIL